MKRSNVTKEEFINEIHRFYELNGKIPRYMDFNKEWISNRWAKILFGSWNNAIIAAGYEPTQKLVYSYTKEELIEQLNDYYLKYQKVPTQRSMKEKGYAGVKAFHNNFGSFKNALEQAELLNLREDIHQFCDSYTDNELLELLKEYMKTKERIPTHEQMKQEMKSPNVSTYNRRFGTVYNALKLIGYNVDEQRDKDNIILEDDMIVRYKMLADVLGYTPSSRDIDKYCKKGFGYAMKTYESHFGSLSNVQKLCGFIPTVIGRSKAKKELIEDLIHISEELGRTPSQNDLKFFDFVASSSKYADVFGSWNKAIEESGLKPNSDVYFSNNGEKCLSYYELLFCNMLEDFNILSTKENYYKDYINTDRKYRFDFVIDYKENKYFIEIFGITCREDYKKRIEDKIELCKSNNLKLIEIYPKDFTSYKSKELHSMLLNKIDKLNT